MDTVFSSTQHYSQPQSPHDSSTSASQVSNASSGSGATSSENQQQHHQLAAQVPKKRTGRRVFRETRHPVYRGVRSRKGGKWVCELREPNTGTRVWLGTYTSPEMAARAHDVAALALRGKSACLNFADSAWRLPIPASTDAIEVRRAAAEAAEMFRPGSGTEAADDEQEHMTGGGGDYIDNGESNNNSILLHVAEEELEMPRLLSEMAEGLLLSPPPCYAAGSGGWSYTEESCYNNNDIAAEYDWSLWS